MGHTPRVWAVMRGEGLRKEILKLKKRRPSHQSHYQSGSHHVVWMSPWVAEPRLRGF